MMKVNKIYWLLFGHAYINEKKHNKISSILFLPVH